MPEPSKFSLHNRLRSFKAFFAIVHATWLEAIQQPAVFLTILTSVAFTLAVPIFQMHVFGEEGRLARDSALSCFLLFGVTLATGIAVRSVGGEIASGTAAAAIGKPVGRLVYLLAKMTGVYCVIVGYAVSQFAALLLAERCSAHTIALPEFAGPSADPYTLLLALASLAAVLLLGAAFHFFWRLRFGVTVFVGTAVALLSMLALSEYTRIHVAFEFRVFPVMLLLLFALAVFTVVVCSLSVRLRPGVVFVGVLLLLGAGLAGDSLPAWMSGLVLDLQNFWLCDALAYGGTVPGSYVALAGLSALLSCAFFATIGFLMFKNKDLG